LVVSSDEEELPDPLVWEEESVEEEEEPADEELPSDGLAVWEGFSVGVCSDSFSVTEEGAESWLPLEG